MSKNDVSKPSRLKSLSDSVDCNNTVVQYGGDNALAAGVSTGVHVYSNGGLNLSQEAPIPDGSAATYGVSNSLIAIDPTFTMLIAL